MTFDLADLALAGVVIVGLVAVLFIVVAYLAHEAAAESGEDRL